MKRTFKPGHGYTRKDWNAVASPPASEKQLARAKPFAAAFPEIAERMRRAVGRPKSENPKQAVSLRLDRAVIDKFKATGPGWQSRINDALKRVKV